MKVKELPRPVQEAERPTRPWYRLSVAGDATDIGRAIRVSTESPTCKMEPLLTAVMPPPLYSNMAPLGSIMPELRFIMAAPQVVSMMAPELGFRMALAAGLTMAPAAGLAVVTLVMVEAGAASVVAS